jgi:hypothetical protein
MTDERDDLLEILDKIRNNDGWWLEVKFVRLPKGGCRITAVDQYDTSYKYEEVVE